MKEVRWSPLKSERLKRTRGVSFEEVVGAKLIDVLEHPKKANQRIMVYEHKRYLWAVPFVEEENIIFLKTIFPSRKLMKKYKKERQK
jgi:hypothetical protein